MIQSKPGNRPYQLSRWAETNNINGEYPVYLRNSGRFERKLLNGLKRRSQVISLRAKVATKFSEQAALYPCLILGCMQKFLNSI